MTSDDFVLAFFPCIRFCSVMEQLQHEDFYDATQRRKSNYGTSEYYIRKWRVLRNYSQERFRLYDLALKMFAVCQIRGLRMVMENPWHPVNFTNHFWFARVSLIDKDRTRRGDVYRKPTAYWFVNCKPTHGFSYCPTPKDRIKVITSGSGASRTKRKMAKTMERRELDSKYIDHTSKSGICDESRSMISPDYARNFIADFIIGKPSGKVAQQQDLFEQ